MLGSMRLGQLVRSTWSRHLRWLYRHATKRVIRGIHVGVLSSSEDEQKRLFEKVTTALEILNEHGRRCVVRLRAHANGVFVFGSSGDVVGRWELGAKLVVLQEEYVGDPSTSPADVASTLVHESTQAWLDSLGVPYTSDCRARVEAVCFRSELAFVRRLPEPGDLVDRVEQALALDPAFWTDEAIRARTVSTILELGMPKWFAKLLTWLASQGHHRTARHPRRRPP